MKDGKFVRSFCNHTGLFIVQFHVAKIWDKMQNSASCEPNVPNFCSLELVYQIYNQYYSVDHILL